MDCVLYFCYDEWLPVFVHINGEYEGDVLCWNDLLNRVERTFARIIKGKVSRVYDFREPREHNRLSPFVHADVEHHLLECTRACASAVHTWPSCGKIKPYLQLERTNNVVLFVSIHTHTAF
jgi:hypothetical protein